MFGEYTADITRNCISHLILEEERFAARGDCHSLIKGPLSLPLQIPLEGVGAKNECDKEEVEIFVSDPSMNEHNADV